MSLLLCLVLTAEAFAPSVHNLVGSEPTRARTEHAWKQAAYASSGAWTEFIQGEGQGWSARFDEETGTAFRAWGPGVPLGTVDSEPTAEREVRAFLARNLPIVAVPLSALRTRSVNYVARTDTWYVEFDQYVGDYAIWRAGIAVRIQGGSLVMLSVDTHPEAHVSAPEWTAEQAIEAAEMVGPAPLARHRDQRAKLVVLPLQTDDGLSYRLVYEVRSTTPAPVGQWVVFVDAHSGEIAAWYNDVRFLQGTVSGTHPLRTLDGVLTTTALPLIEVVGDSSGSTAYADESGVYTLADDASATSRLRGKYLSVNNKAGAEGSLAFSVDDPLWDGDSATSAEIASYAFLHQVRAWSLSIAPEVEMATDELRSNVNDNSGSCNAYYDGNVNFYTAGGGCNNTGEIADVNYHEWGHGFHYYSLEGGSWDGSMGEGIGDVISVLLTADSTVAPYFQTNGNGIRDVARDRVYPDDVTGEVHEDGLIFAGAVWDLWEVLMEETGETREERGEAWTLTSTLVANAIKAGPTLETVYDEFVLADDDDGDVTNGTPHICAIAEAFGRHGLGPMGEESALTVNHTALVNAPAGETITVAGTVSSALAACSPFTLQAAEVRYSIDAGTTWAAVPADLSGNDFSSLLPEIPEGTIVQYYLAVQGDDGGDTIDASWPQGGEIAPYTFYVGELVELYCQTFEGADDGGYTHALLSGDEREGADDWVFDVPDGYADDPTAPFSGRRVWGNDLGGGNFNGEYQPDITNRLTSVEIDPGEYTNVVVQYRRWLNVEDGIYDRARVYAGETMIWENHESTERKGDEHTADREWILHTLPATVAGPFTLSWEIESDGGLEMGGWNVDDVCVYAAPLNAPSDSGLVDDTGTDSGAIDNDGGAKDDEAIDVSGGGCGCTSAAGLPGAAVAATGLVALLRRRKR